MVEGGQEILDAKVNSLERDIPVVRYLLCHHAFPALPEVPARKILGIISSVKV